MSERALSASAVVDYRTLVAQLQQLESRLDLKLDELRGLVESSLAGPGGRDRLALTFAETALRLGRSPRTVARMVQRGELHPVVIAGSRMISAAELVRVTTPKTDRVRGRPPRKLADDMPATPASVEALLARHRKRR